MRQIHEKKCFSESDMSSGKVLTWIVKQVDGDEIEDVTDEMLDKLVNGELDREGSIYCKYTVWKFKDFPHTV